MLLARLADDVEGANGLALSLLLRRVAGAGRLASAVAAARRLCDWMIVRRQPLGYALAGLLLALTLITAHAACGLLPSTYALYSGSDIKDDKSVKINGSKLSAAKSGANAYKSDGKGVAVSLTLPDVPAFVASSGATSLSTTGTVAAGSYNQITANSGASFSGGTYYINKLIALSGAQVTLAAGTYYIGSLEASATSSGFRIAVASGPVRLIIGTQLLSGGTGTLLNSGGVADNLRIFLASGASFTVGDSANMAGFVLGSSTTNTVTLGKTAVFKGAILHPGTAKDSLKLGGGTLITFGATEQAALSALSSCLPVDTPTTGRFDAFEPSTSSGSTTGKIRTKVAGQAFTVALVALKNSGTAVDTSFTGSVTAAVFDASDESTAVQSASGCRSGWLTKPALASGTFNFGAGNQGRITSGNLTVADAWKNLRVRVTSGTGGSQLVGCSSDNFAVRPASFSAPVATDATWQTAGTARTLNNSSATGGVVHAAGRPFRVQVNALDASGNVETTYTGSPALVLQACTLPSPCTSEGEAGLAVALNAAVSGTASTDTAAYSEAGVFTAYASDLSWAAVDADDGSSMAERSIVSSAVTIGRFVPDRYALALANTPALAPAQGSACTGSANSSFTWIGQPFGWAVPPDISVTAENAAGETLTQYTGTLFKLSNPATPPTWTVQAASNAPANAALTLSGLTMTQPTGADGVGTASFGSAAVFRFTRPTTPVAPFQAVISLTNIQMADTSESGITIGTEAPLTIDGGGTGIEFQGTNAAGANQQLYGRLQLAGAHGDSRRPLSLVYETQAWSGAAWYRNQRDSCLTPVASIVALSSWANGNVCDASVSSVSQAARGQGLVKLSAPTVARSVRVSANLRLGTASGTSCVNGGSVTATSAGLSWLQGPWTSATGSYDTDPGARATWGRQRSDILMRREQ